jgi:hypothetical protein
MITINNLGFVRFFNRHAEKRWKMKQKEVLGNRVERIFPSENASDVIAAFIHPSRTKTAGIFKGEELQVPGRQPIEADLMVISTDLEDEMLYTLVIL